MNISTTPQKIHPNNNGNLTNVIPLRRKDKPRSQADRLIEDSVGKGMRCMSSHELFQEMAKYLKAALEEITSDGDMDYALRVIAWSIVAARGR